MNKHAYLIIAHNEPEVLRTLLAMLDDVRNDIFVHIDRRARSVYESIKDYRYIAGAGRIYAFRACFFSRSVCLLSFIVGRGFAHQVARLYPRFLSEKPRKGVRRLLDGCGSSARLASESVSVLPLYPLFQRRQCAGARCMCLVPESLFGFAKSDLLQAESRRPYFSERLSMGKHHASLLCLLVVSKRACISYVPLYFVHRLGTGQSVCLARERYR